MLFNTALKACAQAGEARRAGEWHRRLRREGIRLNAKTYGKLIEAAAKARARLGAHEAVSSPTQGPKSARGSGLVGSMCAESCSKLRRDVRCPSLWLLIYRASRNNLPPSSAAHASRTHELTLEGRSWRVRTKDVLVRLVF